MILLSRSETFTLYSRHIKHISVGESLFQGRKSFLRGTTFGHVINNVIRHVKARWINVAKFYVIQGQQPILKSNN